MGSYLYERLTAGAQGEAPALLLAGGQVLSHADLAAAAGRYANALVRLGVKPGDRVAAQLEKSPEVVMLYLGCLRAGAVFLPLNTAYTPAEIGYFLGDATPSVFVCDPAREVEMAAVAGGARIVTLGRKGDGTLADLADGQAETFADIDRGPQDLAAILYTSGTTGRSKGAMLTQANLASNAETLVDYWRITANDILIHALPIYHIHGLFVALNTLLMAGGAMHFLSRFDAGKVLGLMDRATILMGVPTFYVRLLDERGLTPQAVGKMRLFVSGSAPLLAETHRAWQERTGEAILERYGMTETGMNTSNPYEGERIPGSVGFPLPGVDLRIADPETGKVLGTGEIGGIEVKGPNVFAGYWNMPEKTAAEFRTDGFFITGDLGKIDEKGYVHIVGRAKDLVISGGLNVYPIEVEAEIDALPGVVESAVIGLSHKDFGEAVTAVIVPEKGAARDEKAVIAAVSGRLAKFKCPKRVLFVDALPRNAMGKVQKAELRRMFAALYD
ncbi:malonyl-CoA/methylmalonyl-CoA synthetase [Devosia enhydra]|uniref:Malonyl-CoA/methylmalonyl-CoA synthetase n=1 Tax=Devosia enhydra TaxID=665118 RepID=A0A1K2HZX9_9HYPH|nr:malonyl-CoA synthase [Devosia enhydra]SFZ84827.1 malonyl-CoA/methylmalonyl-CoA synthetase [Devosia enhydra]